jgi:hypothetical protein
MNYKTSMERQMTPQFYILASLIHVLMIASFSFLRHVMQSVCIGVPSNKPHTVRRVRTQNDGHRSNDTYHKPLKIQLLHHLCVKLPAYDRWISRDGAVSVRHDGTAGPRNSSIAFSRRANFRLCTLIL